jgi:transketolase
MPADPNQTDRIIRHVAVTPGNHFVGMGRSITPVITDEEGKVFFGADYVFTPGKADWLRRGTDLTLVTYGALVPAVLQAWNLLRQDGVSAGVLNMASLLPLDEESLAAAAAIGPLLTVEDHHVASGLGASAAVALMDRGIAAKLKRLGVSHYASSGKPAELYAEQGLDPKSIAAAARSLMK